MFSGLMGPTWYGNHSSTEKVGQQGFAGEGTGNAIEIVGRVFRNVMPIHTTRGGQR